MTLLVCHREAGRITLLADTRISGAYGVATDSGPKVLGLSIVVSHGHPKPLPPVTGTYGFAFAGSTLAAMSTFAMVSTCLQSLVTPCVPRLPSVESVADLFRRLGERYAREIAAPFECFIAGPAVDGGEPYAFSIRPILHEGLLTMCISELDRNRRGFWALGSGAEPYMAFAHAHKPWASVIGSVQAFIVAQVDPKVGGSLQAGRCDQDGFSPHMMLEMDAGTRAVKGSFLGIDENDLGLVDGLDLGANVLGEPNIFRDGVFTNRVVVDGDSIYRGFWRANSGEPSS